jgi:hypothetical protein
MGEIKSFGQSDFFPALFKSPTTPVWISLFKLNTDKITRA